MSFKGDTIPSLLFSTQKLSIFQRKVLRCTFSEHHSAQVDKFRVIFRRLKDFQEFKGSCCYYGLYYGGKYVANQSLGVNINSKCQGSINIHSKFHIKPNTMQNSKGYFVATRSQTNVAILFH